MSYFLIIIFSIVIAALLYLILIGGFKLGGWMARNEDKRIVKILNKVFTLLFHGSILFLIWALVIQMLAALGYLQII